MASSTAEFMALFRALESTAPSASRLFDDPLAERFLRPSLRAAVRISRHRLGRALVLATLDRLWPGARASGVARTRLIDDALLDAVALGKVEQVVFLGAGFDCRAHRLPMSPAPIYVEVDRPETQAHKRARLAGSRGTEVRYVPCNFESRALRASLEQAGFDPQLSSFFLWEGVTNYLSAAAVDDVLEYVSGSAPGSQLLFTYVDRLALDEPDRFAGSRRLRSLLRRAAEPWTFGLDPAALPGFLEERGLRLVCDDGSLGFRARYLGARGAHLRGYEFYRAALAQVGDSARPTRQAEGAEPCPR